MDESKKSKIEQIHREESAALKRLYKERVRISQEKFGEDFEIGSQGMVWKYLNARSPLNLMAAAKFALGLGCDISDFSQRLADEQSMIAPRTDASLTASSEICILDLVGAINVLAAGHAVLACGGMVQSGRPVKQEPAEATMQGFALV